MRLTIAEQSIVKCICLSKVPVTYSYLINTTRLNFTTVEQSLRQLIAAGRVEIGVQGGFAITKEAKKHPIIRRIMQDIQEERLPPASSRYTHRRQQVNTFLRSHRYAIYSWASKLRRLAISISKAK